MARSKAGLSGEIVSFQASDGMSLSGFLCRPKGWNGTAVINLHGLRGSFYRGARVAQLARSFVRNRIAFLSIEQRGSYGLFTINGTRNGKRKRVIAGGAVEKFEECVFDIGGAIRYLGGIGAKRIYLQGHSTGCQKAVYYMMRKRDRRVKGLVLLAPADDLNIWKSDLYEIWKGKRNRFAEVVAFARLKSRSDPTFPMAMKYGRIEFSAGRFASFADLKNVEARIFNYDSPRMKEFGTVRVPILAVFGTREENAVKPVRDYLMMLAANTKSRDFTGALVKGADHGFDGKEAELSSLVAKWILKRVG